MIAIAVLSLAAIIITALVICVKRNGVRRSLLSNYSSAGSTAGSTSKMHKDQFDHLTNTFPQGESGFSNLSGIHPRTSFENRQYNGSINGSLTPSMTPSDLKFSPTARPSISKNSKNLAVFYPGVPIESIVPNPVYVNNPANENPRATLNSAIYENPQLSQTNKAYTNSNNNIEKLVTSVYVTNAATNENESSNAADHYENQ